MTMTLPYPNVEAILNALLARVVAQNYFRTTGRRLKTWDQVPAEQQPACFIMNRGDVISNQTETLPKTQIDVEIIIYTRADNPDDVPSTILNAAIDKVVNGALGLTGVDIVQGRQTLGGLVSHCRVEGEIFKDPGDLDNQGVSAIPVRILVP